MIAFPDVDGYGNWTEKARERPRLNILVSDYVNRYAEANGLDSGADVTDVLIHWLRNGDSPMKPQQQPYPADPPLSGQSGPAGSLVPHLAAVSG